MKLCEQCNTHPPSYKEAKLCARCALRNLAEMARREGAPEVADKILDAIHDSVPQEWVESGFKKLMTELDENA